jgi:hypothetical protein
MTISIVSNYSKKFAHFAIDSTFPKNDFIAMISVYVGWHFHTIGEHYTHVLLYKYVTSGSWAGFVIGPELAHKIAPYIAHYSGIGTTCATSMTLNLITQLFLKIKSFLNGKVEEKPKIEEKKIEEVQKMPPLRTPIKTRMSLPKQKNANIRPAFREMDDPLLTSECWNIFFCLPIKV